MATKQKESKQYTPADIAEELEVTPLQVRIFLRSQDKGVGRGKRYHFNKKQADAIVKAYNKEHPSDED